MGSRKHRWYISLEKVVKFPYFLPPKYTFLSRYMLWKQKPLGSSRLIKVLYYDLNLIFCDRPWSPDTWIEMHSPGLQPCVVRKTVKFHGANAKNWDDIFEKIKYFWWLMVWWNQGHNIRILADLGYSTREQTSKWVSSHSDRTLQAHS